MATGTHDRLTNLLEHHRGLVADGGMGTSLFAAGLRPGGTPELWNIEEPELIGDVHRGFVDAGADIILTNTFGGSRSRLDLDGLGDRVDELNAAGVAIARSVASAADREVLVGGSVGPTGVLFEPLGPLSRDVAIEVFSEQIDALARAGPDIVWIETMSSLEELDAAVEAASAWELPIVTTMSFDTNGSSMMGISPGDFARWSSSHSIAISAVGANCGIGPADAVVAADEIRAVNPDAWIVAKANCGLPALVDGELWYPASSDDMSSYARFAMDAGARIIGACCGSTPEHIAQIREVVDTYEPADGITLEDVESRVGEVARPAPRATGRRSGRRASN